MFQSISEIGTILFIVAVISGFTSRFRGFQIDIFSVSTGLLLTFLFNLESVLSTELQTTWEGARLHPNLTHYIIIILMFQFGLGILIILSYRAYHNMSVPVSFAELIVRSVTFSISVFLSLNAFFVASILYIYRNDIFGPLETRTGEIIRLIQNVFLREPLTPYSYLILFALIFVLAIIYNFSAHWRQRAKKGSCHEVGDGCI